ncbi:hypothetical protein TNCV_1949921 [Trichonephila clavipes]|nr:hypothetical protein TNCV_1949921 [Trichonephila clavipes]
MEEIYNSPNIVTTFPTFEEELKGIEEKRKGLPGKIVLLLSCLVPCIHNFSSKSLMKRLSEPIIKPAMLTVANKNVDEDSFPSPSKSV